VIRPAVVPAVGNELSGASITACGVPKPGLASKLAPLTFVGGAEIAFASCPAPALSFVTGLIAADAWAALRPTTTIVAIAATTKRTVLMRVPLCCDPDNGVPSRVTFSIDALLSPCQRQFGLDMERVSIPSTRRRRILQSEKGAASYPLAGIGIDGDGNS
jgi:hypothetical protein